MVLVGILVALGSGMALSVGSSQRGDEIVTSRILIQDDQGQVVGVFGLLEAGKVGLQLSGEAGQLFVGANRDGSSPVITSYDQAGRQRLAVTHGLVKVYGEQLEEAQLVAGPAGAQLNLIDGKTPARCEINTVGEESEVRFSGAQGTTLRLGLEGKRSTLEHIDELGRPHMVNVEDLFRDR